MDTMPHMDKVREHLEQAAHHHRKSHEEAAREAAIARAEEDAGLWTAAPQTGLQAQEEGFWQIGAED